MKSILFSLPAWLFIGAGILLPARAQVINWHQMHDSSRHVVSLSAHYDFSFGYGLSYGQKLRIRQPFMVTASLALPLGKSVFDDGKLRAGGQGRIWERGNFMGTVGASLVYRWYQSSMVGMNSLGAEAGGVIGYYRPRWHLAGEVTADQVFTTYLHQRQRVLDMYPGARSGWYRGAGTLLSAGAQTGFSFSHMAVTLRGGYVFTPRGYVSVIIPCYFQVGINRRF